MCMYIMQMYILNTMEVALYKTVNPMKIANVSIVLLPFF